MIKKLTEREHIIKRPTMYIGAVDLTSSNEYILSDNDKIEYQEVKYVPGFIKIINEIIDNSVDVAIKSNFKSSNEISIKMTNEFVEVQDNAEIPIIFLTAKTLKEDILEGFKIGADDYITKPFSMEELTFRIEAFAARTSCASVKPSFLGIITSNTHKSYLFFKKAL
jgi:DNA-binding NarL/FixJ family response regulator